MNINFIMLAQLVKINCKKLSRPQIKKKKANNIKISRTPKIRIMKRTRVKTKAKETKNMKINIIYKNMKEFYKIIRAIISGLQRLVKFIQNIVTFNLNSRYIWMFNRRILLKKMILINSWIVLLHFQSSLCRNL